MSWGVGTRPWTPYIYRLHAAAGRRDEAASASRGVAGICEPDEAAYRAVIDAEIEMGQAA